ncbi:YbjN domain-containing protein [Micromonospora purpureochromogenes]|uniref:YbjN domain-containing protein n=1 Tax=Micromonospora TaxID=1873 RepID=UPI001A4DF4C9|nr:MULTISPECIES: YbjN domain-containing protein [unclassified Micromonospora]MBM0260186.1 YbjN domain-containing protein [Micromonospora sp. 4G55]MBQ0893819.1 YbjN domain-containing protein [Micromonospora sp. U56]
MPWWSWRPGPAAGGGDPETRTGITVDSTVRVGPPSPRQPGDDCTAADRPVIADMPVSVEPVTLRRVCEALDLLDVRYLADGDGNLLAMWERHAVLVTLEGPEDEILVMRARPHATVPPDWADRAYRVVNEWNHTRRFCKAYIGDPTERGQLPIYAELQVPLGAGTHDALLVEMLDCGAAVATTFVDWLHDEGALL